MKGDAMKTLSHFKTAKAARYLGTLCKHFGHKVPAGFDETSGWVDLPFARCDMTADAAGLTLSVEADTQQDLDRATRVIGSHLERFAFRETPDLIWRDAANETAHHPAT